METRLEERQAGEEAFCAPGHYACLVAQRKLLPRVQKGRSYCFYQQVLSPTLAQAVWPNSALGTVPHKRKLLCI